MLKKLPVMNNTDNLKIVQRVLELAGNRLEYTVHPKTFKEEHIFLANVLNTSLSKLQDEFDKEFKKIVLTYKETLSGKGRFPKSRLGWFHDPEKIIWINMQMNQLRYAIYGEEYTREIVYKPQLKARAYKDLIQQIDCTVLMTPAELKKHMAQCNKIAKDVVNKILKEEKK